MKKLIPLCVLLVSGAATAGGPSPGHAPSNFNPPNKRKIVFAFNPQVANIDRNRRGQQYVDYLNWLFSMQRVALKVSYSTDVLPYNVWKGEVFHQPHASMLSNVRQRHGADLVMVMNPSYWDAGGECGYRMGACWSSVNTPFKPGHQVVAHEFGHWLGIQHWYGEDSGWTRKPYAVGYGTWAWVDLMHYPAYRGKGLITKDTYSDHEVRCDAFYMCGDWTWGSAGRHLRETWGRW